MHRDKEARAGSPVRLAHPERSVAIQALANGSLDTVNTCVCVCNFPFYESVPEMEEFP